MARFEAVRRKVEKCYGELRNWRRVGAELGISGGMAYRIAVDGYEPREAQIRVRLGLAAMAEAPVCERCGVVHVSKRCTGKRRRGRDLWELEADVLRMMLERREEIGR